MLSAVIVPLNTAQPSQTVGKRRSSRQKNRGEKRVVCYQNERRFLLWRQGQRPWKRQVSVEELDTFTGISIAKWLDFLKNKNDSGTQLFLVPVFSQS